MRGPAPAQSTPRPPSRPRLDFLDLSRFGLAGNLAIFAFASAVVWMAGVRLARGADALADKAGLGHAYVGVFLLGAMVSLPEMTFSAVAALCGNAALAVNGLLGGIGMTMVVLAITDAVVGREPLSTDIQRPVVIFQGAMVILMLAVAAGGIVAGDRLLPAVGGAGYWTLGLVALYGFTIVVAKRIEPHPPWKAKALPVQASDREKAKGEKARAAVDREEQRSLGAIALHTAVAALAVVGAATLMAFNAEVIAEETGLGDSFVGFVFGGIATTLPELSTTIAAARLRQYEMAFSDGFGTNLCSTGLIFLADALYPGGPILNEVGVFSTFGVLLGIALTTVYLAGFIVRSPRSVLRMGLDSHAVLVLAVLGFGVLYALS